MPKFIIKFDNTFFDEDDQMDGFEIDSKDIEDLLNTKALQSTL
jgi:hypothetical protein